MKAKIPHTYKEAFAILDKRLKKAEKIELGQSKDLDEYHFELGLWIRNNWIHTDVNHEYLCEEAKSPEDRMIFAPDDKSDDILHRYQKHLRSKYNLRQNKQKNTKTPMLSTNQMIEEAIRIAYEAHKGFTDLDGKPVILHPMSVAAMGESSDEIICGWLHDVVEDNSDWSFDKLHDAGFSDAIIDTLRLLTKPETIPYLDYVQAIAQSGNAVAIRTKYHDLQHNLARGRAGGHTKQVQKHEQALPIIEAALALL